MKGKSMAGLTSPKFHRESRFRQILIRTPLFQK